MEYVDGMREQSYGRYRDDSRWLLIAEDIVRHVRLKAACWVLDVGRGKGFLVSPSLEALGINISEYARDELRGGSGGPPACWQRTLLAVLHRLRRLFCHEP